MRRIITDRWAEVCGRHPMRARPTCDLPTAPLHAAPLTEPAFARCHATQVARQTSDEHVTSRSSTRRSRTAPRPTRSVQHGESSLRRRAHPIQQIWVQPRHTRGSSSRCRLAPLVGSPSAHASSALICACVNGSFNIRTRQGGCEQVGHGARTDATM